MTAVAIGKHNDFSVATAMVFKAFSVSLPAETNSHTI